MHIYISQIYFCTAQAVWSVFRFKARKSAQLLPFATWSKWMSVVCSLVGLNSNSASDSDKLLAVAHNLDFVLDIFFANYNAHVAIYSSMRRSHRHGCLEWVSESDTVQIDCVCQLYQSSLAIGLYKKHRILNAMHPVCTSVLRTRTWLNPNDRPTKQTPSFVHIARLIVSVQTIRQLRWRRLAAD